MLEFRAPVPVSTPLGEGYALYVTNGGAFENDIWCVVLDDSRILHFRTNDLRYVGNATLAIAKPKPLSDTAAAAQLLAAKVRAP